MMTDSVSVRRCESCGQVCVSSRGLVSGCCCPPRGQASAAPTDPRLKAVAAAFVTETRRAPGDYDPARRFRAHLPGGRLAYGATRGEAEAAFWAAVEREKEGGGE